METKKKSTLSFGLRYGYGLGEFGLNFLLTYITYYLTFYLTNVAGLSMTLAATVTTATTVIKVFGMPIAGTLIDSIKLKGSKFRGWMVLGGVLYFVGAPCCSIGLTWNLAHMPSYFVSSSSSIGWGTLHPGPAGVP